MSGEAVTVLAFDFGEHHIGIAVGHTLTGHARALTDARGGRRPDWTVIDAAVNEWQPDLLVVGSPLNMDGSEQRLTQLARRFGRQLHARYQLPTAEADERLSSVEARQRIVEQQRRRDSIHSVSAEVIFETWLEQSAHTQGRA
ncbi:MAG: Holliday junction resolvase RuvX [Pseudomonadota bacterium]